MRNKTGIRGSSLECVERSSLLVHDGCLMAVNAGLEIASRVIVSPRARQRANLDEARESFAVSALGAVASNGVRAANTRLEELLGDTVETHVYSVGQAFELELSRRRGARCQARCVERMEVEIDNDACRVLHSKFH